MNSIKEPLLKKIFQFIQKRNYYLDEDKCDRKNMLEGETIYNIEKFFIDYYNTEYIYTKNSELPVSDKKQKDLDYTNMKYYIDACEWYQKLESEINLFLQINIEKDKYSCIDCTLDEHRDIFLHSIEIVKKEIESIKIIHPKLYKEVEECLISLELEINTKDPIQNKYSGLLSYIQVLEKSKTNFFLESKYRKKFYPIIVDIFLDYVNIMDIIYAYNDIIKNKVKRYTDFRNDLMNSDIEFHAVIYYLIKFRKLERSNNIKRYMLKHYLEAFNNDKNINILFRKLFLKNLNERKDYSPSDMNNYKTSSHLIFSTLINSQNIL